MFDMDKEVAERAVRNIKERLVQAGMSENAEIFAGLFTMALSVSLLKVILSCESKNCLPNPNELDKVINIVTSEISSSLAEAVENATSQIH